MNSSLAEKVVTDKGRIKRNRVAGIIIHTTGSTLVEHARQVGADPETFAVEHYLQAAEYPHYLVAHDGSIYSFCSELKWSAHAAWRPWERLAYQHGTWVSRWARDYHDNVVEVEASFYKEWFDRWLQPDRGAVQSPWELLCRMTNPDGANSPNEATVGIEVLDAKPFTDLQLAALAALVLDIGKRHGIPFSFNQTVPWPNVWVLGHSDISPCRRWGRNRSDKAPSPRWGYPWDPANSNLVWSVLGEAVESAKGKL